MELGRRKPIGKRWAAAQAVAVCAAERPGAKIAIVSRDFQSSRAAARLIAQACTHLGVFAPATCHMPRFTLRWPNGAEAKFYLAERPLDQCGERHHLAWVDDLRRSQDALATLEAIAYGLRAEDGLGTIVETGAIGELSYPQLRDCQPRLIEAAGQFLALNGAWGTVWSVRDSDAEPSHLTFRWADCRARISLVPEVPHPLFCVSSPGLFVDTWIGKPRRHEAFAERIQAYRWDGGGRRLIRPMLIDGKTVSDCVAIAERIGGRKI